MRKSLRIRDRNDGFKHNSCANKNCLACAALPPTLPISALKNIGEKIYKIEPDKLFDEALSAKSSNKKAIGGKKTPKKATAATKELEKSKKKKVDDVTN